MQDGIFQINKGDTLTKVTHKLKKFNFITNVNFFVITSIVFNRDNIKIGKYRISNGMSSLEIAKKLSRGEIVTKKITIPEGFNIYQIAERMEAEEITSSKKFLNYCFDSNFINSIGISASSAEGYIFPDTYIFPLNSNARDIIIIMHNRLKKILKSIVTSKMNKLGLNLHQLLTLSSLVEKEAKIASERKYISAVFHNRLKRGVKLDSCATILYATKKFKGKLRYRDLRYNSPYNTYQNKGLPPTPICSPGRESIYATLNPVRANYLYFVSRNDGSHYFSKNLKEHNRAVDYYQKDIKNGFIDRQKL